MSYVMAEAPKVNLFDAVMASRDKTLKLPPAPSLCGCMTGPNDPDPNCDECFGTGLYGEAKAALFAATPDLLAALQLMIRFHDGEDDTRLPHLRFAREVLARAEGRS
jgi:hypothetical protein